MFGLSIRKSIFIALTLITLLTLSFSLLFFYLQNQSFEGFHQKLSRNSSQLIKSEELNLTLNELNYFTKTNTDFNKDSLYLILNEYNQSIKSLDIQKSQEISKHLELFLQKDSIEIANLKSLLQEVKKLKDNLIIENQNLINEYENQKKGIFLKFWLAAIGILSIAIIFSLWFSINITKSLRTLLKIIQEIVRGDFNQRLIVRKKDEIGQIAMAFNQMADNIQNIIEDIERINSEMEGMNVFLEVKVKERTQELEEAIQKIQSAQEQMLLSEKMAALGQLVAGVAHEVNTPIGIAVTSASFLKHETDNFLEKMKDGQVKKSDFVNYTNSMGEASKIILENLQRAANLIQSFKKVSVTQTADEIEEFNIYQYVKDTINTLSPEFKRTKIVPIVEGNEDIIVNNYASALSQIIINFVTNSMVHGFEDHSQPGNIFIRIMEGDSEGFVKIIYQDTGKGIPADILPKIFDPFFTTKRGKGGSGLGLNIVYNLITQKLGGSVQVTSELGKGTTFEINLKKNITL